MFFKNDNGHLTSGSNVFSGNYRLTVESEKPVMRVAEDDWKEAKEYKTPIDGWHWFDTEKEAKTALNIVEVKINDKMGME